MARYIDVDAMIADLAKLENGYLYADGDTEKYEFVYGTLTGVRQAITYAKAQPTADVAPRAEVALEVIGEVEKMARDYIDGIMLLDPQNPYCFGGINAFENVIEFLAELKKKYTEQKGE